MISGQLVERRQNNRLIRRKKRNRFRMHHLFEIGFVKNGNKNEFENVATKIFVYYGSEKEPRMVEIQSFIKKRIERK